MHGWSLGGCNNCPNRLVTLFVLLPSQMFVVEMVSVTYHHVLSITCTRICYFVCVCVCACVLGPLDCSLGGSWQ